MMAMVAKVFTGVKRSGEMLRSVEKIFQRKDSLSICPFYDIATEYRVIMLDGRCMLCFGKQKTPDGWKFNLCQGASAYEVEEGALKEELVTIARKAMETIGIRFASVDIVKLKTGEFMMIEVNSGVMIHHYTKFVANGREIAKRIYQEAIEKMLQ